MDHHTLRAPATARQPDSATDEAMERARSAAATDAAMLALDLDALEAYYRGRRGPHAAAQRRRIRVARALHERACWYAAALDVAGIRSRERVRVAVIRTTWPAPEEVTA